jgi:signal transduction histidine kinase/ActR/RegA family two-component response regulator
MATSARNASSSPADEAEEPAAVVHRGTAFELELEYLDIDQAMSLSRGVIAPHFLILVAFLGLMLPYSPLWGCVLWAGGFALFLAARVLMNAQYARLSVAERKADAHHWRRAAVANAFIYGSLVGIAALMAFPGSPLELRLLWTLILTMVVAAAPRLVTMHQVVALATPTLLLLCDAWLMVDDSLGPPVAATLLALTVPFGLLTRHFHLDRREKFRLQVSNEKLFEELARRNQSLEQMALSRTMLLATASHDLRQPMHALGLLMEAIKQTRNPRSLRRFHTLAAENVAVLSEMMTNLLDFTRMENASLQVRMQATPLQDLIEESARMYAPLAQQKGLQLHAAAPMVLVHTDPYLLRRLLFNLVSNAIKYTAKGEIDIEVERLDDEVVLHVRDTGVGIAPERLDEVFNDFVTADPKASRFDQGIGLGLGIVRRSVELMGHQLSVRSELGRGSCFSVHLGHVVVASPTMAQCAENADPLLGVVAVVENDVAILNGMEEMLRAWGCNPVTGASSHKVQSMLTTMDWEPKLIIADFHLGTENGLKAIETLRKTSGAAHAPALLLTGDLASSLQARCLAEGVRLEYKPLRPVRLREIIREMLHTSGNAQKLPVN